MAQTPIIHRHSDAFDDRNMVLHLALGLVSVRENLRAALTPADVVPDETLTDLLVGLIHLTDIAAEAVAAAEAPAPLDGAELRGDSALTERTLFR